MIVKLGIQTRKFGVQCPPESARLLLSNLEDPKSLWQSGKPPAKLVRIVNSESEFQTDRFTTNEWMCSLQFPKMIV